MSEVLEIAGLRELPQLWYIRSYREREILERETIEVYKSSAV